MPVTVPDVTPAALGGLSCVMAFESLDYLYTPSSDVPADVRYFTEVLGGRLVFAIDDGQCASRWSSSATPAAIVLNDHLEGERPILVYRVASLRVARTELEANGWSADHSLEIPQGPVTTFTAPGGQRLAIYELARPGVIEGFAGRRDF
jgi:hypothetical protein